MSKVKKIFCSGTMRTGGSLVSNLLSVHKDVIILHDIVHFFRYIFKRYDPIKNKSSLYCLCGELSLRLRHRDNIKIDRKIFYNEMLKNKTKTYGDAYESIFNVFLKKIPKKKLLENMQMRIGATLKIS